MSEDYTLRVRFFNTKPWKEEGGQSPAIIQQGGAGQPQIIVMKDDWAKWHFQPDNATFFDINNYAVTTGSGSYTVCTYTVPVGSFKGVLKYIGQGASNLSAWNLSPSIGSAWTLSKNNNALQWFNASPIQQGTLLSPFTVTLPISGGDIITLNLTDYVGSAWVAAGRLVGWYWST